MSNSKCNNKILFFASLLTNEFIAKDSSGTINSSHFNALASIKSDHKIDSMIDISRLDPNKDLNTTTTALEFFVVSLSKHLSLTPKQVFIECYHISYVILLGYIFNGKWK